MNAIHRIRLRGPWEVSAIEAADGGSLPQPAKMQCPCTWKEGGWAGFRGRALHLRRFGRPRQSDPRERVWLVVEPCQGSLVVDLNHVPIGQATIGSAFEADVTDRLLERNELSIEVSGSDDQCGLTGEVRLEIRTQA